MRDILTEQQIESFRDQGFLVIDDFLDTGELEAWRQAVATAVAGEPGHEIPEQADDYARIDELEQTDPGRAEALRYARRVYTARTNLWQRHPEVAELVLDERIGRMVAQLEGIDAVRIWHDQALFKQAYAAPTPWHADEPFFSFTSAHQVTHWIALDDAPIERGCLFYVPGSHLPDIDRTLLLQPRQSSIPGMDAVLELFPDLGKLEPVAAAVPAGGCVFHNGRTIHASGLNMTPHTRRAITTHYYDDGAPFDGTRNILSDEQLAGLEVGDPIRGDAFPIVHPSPVAS